MHVTVVIPTFNRAGELEQALLRLLAARGSAPCECEIFVVDNSSTDTMAAVAPRSPDRAALAASGAHG